MTHPTKTWPDGVLGQELNATTSVGTVNRYNSATNDNIVWSSVGVVEGTTAVRCGAGNNNTSGGVRYDDENNLGEPFAARAYVKINAMPTSGWSIMIYGCNPWEEQGWYICSDGWLRYGYAADAYQSWMAEYNAGISQGDVIRFESTGPAGFAIGGLYQRIFTKANVNGTTPDFTTAAASHDNIDRTGSITFGNCRNILGELGSPLSGNRDFSVDGAIVQAISLGWPGPISQGGGGGGGSPTSLKGFGIIKG
jgi:hypothetical protein